MEKIILYIFYILSIILILTTSKYAHKKNLSYGNINIEKLLYFKGIFTGSLGFY